MRLAVLLCLAACSKSAPSSGPRGELGAPGAPFGPFADVRIGMTAAELAAAAPALELLGDPADIASAELKTPDSAILNVHRNRVESLQISSKRITMDDVAAAWGPGGRFLDPAHHVRCDVEANPTYSAAFVWQAYVPAAELLGGAPDAVDGVPVIGRSIDNVTAELGAKGLQVHRLSPELGVIDHVPATDVGDGPLVELAIADDHVTRVSSHVPVDAGGMRAVLVDAMTAKFGGPPAGDASRSTWQRGDLSARVGGGSGRKIVVEYGKL